MLATLLGEQRGEKKRKKGRGIRNATAVPSVDISIRRYLALCVQVAQVESGKCVWWRQ